MTLVMSWCGKRPAGLETVWHRPEFARARVCWRVSLQIDEIDPTTGQMLPQRDLLTAQSPCHISELASAVDDALDDL